MKRRFLFSTIAGSGHFHPLVPLARALISAGHRVAFASSSGIRKAVEAAGFAFLEVGGDMDADPDYREVKAQLAHMPMNLQTELFTYPRLFCGVASRVRTPFLVSIAQEWQADMIIREAGEYASLIAAEHLNLPYATVAFAAALDTMAHFEREAALYLDPVRQAWGLPPDPTVSAPFRYLHLSYSPPSFAMQRAGQPGVENRSWPYPPTTHSVRPQFFDDAFHESAPDWLTRLSPQPLVYVTMGTQVNSEAEFYPRVLQTIIEGLRDLPINLVVTLGRDKDPNDFGRQPENVRIERYIPQSVLLHRCDLMVMHGGSNTLLQALDCGLLTVAIPLIADQFYNAHVMERLQLGRVVQLGQLTQESIRAAVREVLDNPLYKRNVARLQAEMHALPGQERAVELVNRVATDPLSAAELGLSSIIAPPEGNLPLSLLT